MRRCAPLRQHHFHLEKPESRLVLLGHRLPLSAQTCRTLRTNTAFYHLSAFSPFLPTFGIMPQSDLHRTAHLAAASSCIINLRNEVVYPCDCLVKGSDSDNTQLCRIIKRFPPLIFYYTRWPDLHLSVRKQSNTNLAKCPKIYRLVGDHELQIDKILNTLAAWLGETVQFLRNLMRDGHDRNWRGQRESQRNKNIGDFFWNRNHLRFVGITYLVV